MAEDDVVICAVARTPVGRFRGALSGYSAVELGVLAVKELLRRAGIAPESGVVNELLFGQVLQAGAGQAPARQVALGAGLPPNIPATTINKVCGSGLKTVMLATNSIRAREYEAIICGGMESMTNAPHLVWSPSKDEEVAYGDLQHSMIHDGLWDVYNDEHMGMTGESASTEFDITRRASDEFAVRSHAMAHQAWENGWLDWEAFPVAGIDREGNEITLSVDEGIRAGLDLEALAELKPAFTPDGLVTAGNASQISDGAAAILVARESVAQKNGWPILATVIDQYTSGLEPARVMAAPIPAILALLERNSLSIDDLAFIEHNEAFAAASCAVAKGVGIPDEKFNPHGGAVAIGHPLGASGARCLMTLINALQRNGGGKGIVTLCLGGGNAVAMLIES
jgi:acetyl-CoA C-acetyltransferase